MQAVAILASIFGLIVIFMALILGTIATFIRILKGDVSRKSQKYDAEETGMIQEIFQGLSRMEERVETLETLLLDRERKEKRQ
jgi:phage shock protein B